MVLSSQQVTGQAVKAVCICRIARPVCEVCTAGIGSASTPEECFAAQIAALACGSLAQCHSGSVHCALRSSWPPDSTPAYMQTSGIHKDSGVCSDCCHATPDCLVGQQPNTCMHKCAILPNRDGMTFELAGRIHSAGHSRPNRTCCLHA